MNYLAASRAAFEQGKIQAADQWLKEAEQTSKNAELAVGIMQAEQLISLEQNEQALAILLKLQQQHSKHTYLLKMLVKLCVQLEDWKTLQNLMPTIHKVKPYGIEKVDAMEERMQLQLLEREGRNGNSSQLKQLYQSFPRNARSSLPIAKRYIEFLNEQSNDKLAEQELRGILKSSWHDDLVRLYGKVKGDDAKSQLLFTEKQLTERTNDPVLLYVLGELSLRVQNTAKAAEYLEAGLKLKNLPELHAAMGKVQLAEGNEARACEHFKLALS